MDRRQLVLPDLQPPCLPHPGQRPFHHVADLAPPAPVWRPLPRQVVLDTALLEPLLVARRAVGAISIQGPWLVPGPAAPDPDGRDVVHQLQRLKRFVAVGPGEAHGQRGPFAIDEQVPFGAFFGPIRGVFAGEGPPKTARNVWLSTQQCSPSMPSSWPTRGSNACRGFFHTPLRCQ